jgi:hypothetical protein
MNPDHFRDVVWIPALKKADIAYRPPIQTRHTFATMMLSAGEDVGWVQNMLGHSSLQMIFQRYYAWIPQKTRSDGQAFRSYKQRVQPQLEEDVSLNADVPRNAEKTCPKIVPIEYFRQKKAG